MGKFRRRSTASESDIGNGGAANWRRNILPPTRQWDDTAYAVQTARRCGRSEYFGFTHTNPTKMVGRAHTSLARTFANMLALDDPRLRLDAVSGHEVTNEMIRSPTEHGNALSDNARAPAPECPRTARALIPQLLVRKIGLLDGYTLANVANLLADIERLRLYVY